MPKKKKGTVKVYCSSCNHLTIHEVVWSDSVERRAEDDDGLWEHTTYQSLSCMGCKNISFRTVYVFSDDIDPETGELMEKIKYYPYANERMVKEIDHLYLVPSMVKRIYSETIEAYNNELRTLCAIGIRATIEAICLEKGVTNGNLNHKINELITKSIITKPLGDGLQESRLLGNDSAHGLNVFGDEELKAAIKLIENVIESNYIVMDRIATIKSRRPKKKN